MLNKSKLFSSSSSILFPCWLCYNFMCLRTDVISSQVFSKLNIPQFLNHSPNDSSDWLHTYNTQYVPGTAEGLGM